jgi:hypothetical protein
LVTDIDVNRSSAIVVPPQEYSNDPAARLSFNSRLDSSTQAMEESQIIVQQFFECRIAALERYIAFCVMFHAMAKGKSYELAIHSTHILTVYYSFQQTSVLSPMELGTKSV